MEKLQLKSTKRDIKASSPVKLRKQGMLPAVIYGHKTPSQSLSVALADFEKVFKKAGESTIIELITEDGKTHPVIIHDVHQHFLTSKPIHVDFYAVSMTEKLKTKVALEFTGESKAVKELGGVLVKVINEIEVECLPADLPHNVPVDVSALNTFQDNIHVHNLKIPSNVKILTSQDEIVAKIQPPRDVEAELAAPVVEDITAVEGAAETKPETAEDGKEGPKASAEPAKEKAPAKEKGKEEPKK